MSIKLTDTQIAQLSAGAQRDDRCLVPPQNLRSGAAQKVAAKLIDACFVKEIRAKPEVPAWRQDERAGQYYALKLTAAGLRAIAGDNRSGSDHGSVAAANSEVTQQITAEVPTTDAVRSSAPRAGTKLARVLELLQRDCGATLEELIEATDWLPHTKRAALTGLRKRGCSITIARSDKERGSTYRVQLSETINVAQTGSQSEDPPKVSATPKSKALRLVENPRARRAAQCR